MNIGRSTAKRFVRIFEGARRHSSPPGLRFVEVEGSWSDAVSQTSTYADPRILGRVAAATRDVIAGRAQYERDSVLFDEASTPFQVVAPILRSAVQDDGAVEVIDFGGSLGSTYRQCRGFLAPVAALGWHVIEQPEFVRVGRREFTTTELTFHDSITEIPVAPTPATFLSSAALQYVEHPGEVIASFVGRPARHLIIDRAPVSALREHRLCIQHTPASIYEASYPAWVFSRERLLSWLSPEWRLVSDEPGADGRHETTGGLPFEFRTIILEPSP